jgi:hypothetical protein
MQAAFHDTTSAIYAYLCKAVFSSLHTKYRFGREHFLPESWHENPAKKKILPGPFDWELFFSRSQEEDSENYKGRGVGFRFREYNRIRN